MAAMLVSDVTGLAEILKAIAPSIDASLSTVLFAISAACGEIGDDLRTFAADAKAGSENTFGDEQLKVDLHADKIIFERLRACGAVACASSEEQPEEVAMGGSGYSVGFDPLDGSSIVDANFAVGSIFGVWPGSRLLGRTGREQSAAAVATYGPRTTLLLGLPASVTGGEPVAFELTYSPKSKRWTVTKDRFTIAPVGKIFAPGNLRATSDNPRYKALFDHWVTERYTLRYTGGMVPDVVHMFIKGKGIFSNVSSPTAKAKLRLLYECAPLALLVEAAGGASVVAPDVGGPAGEAPMSVLDLLIDNLDRRLGVCYGGTAEVDIFKRFMF